MTEPKQTLSGQKRIGIVEDAMLVAIDIEDCLRKSGYEIVFCVGSGEEAITEAQRAAPNLVLMDIRLAGSIDGIEAARVLAERMDVAVVYLTANTDPETLRRAEATKPLGFISKPFIENDLRAKVAAALRVCAQRNAVTPL